MRNWQDVITVGIFAAAAVAVAFVGEHQLAATLAGAAAGLAMRGGGGGDGGGNVFDAVKKTAQLSAPVTGALVGCVVAALFHL